MKQPIDAKPDDPTQSTAPTSFESFEYPPAVPAPSSGNEVALRKQHGRSITQHQPSGFRELRSPNFSSDSDRFPILRSQRQAPTSTDSYAHSSQPLQQRYSRSDSKPLTAPTSEPRIDGHGTDSDREGPATMIVAPPMLQPFGLAPSAPNADMWFQTYGSYCPPQQGTAQPPYWNAPGPGNMYFFQGNATAPQYYGPQTHLQSQTPARPAAAPLQHAPVTIAQAGSIGQNTRDLSSQASSPYRPIQPVRPAPSKDAVSPAGVKRRMSEGSSRKAGRRGSGGIGSPSGNPGPIPASQPRVVEEKADGVRIIEFEYNRQKEKHPYEIRCNVEDVNLAALDKEFKKRNCVYPKALVQTENKQRKDYETQCNELAWALVALNPDLDDKRGLIQRAVDSWRNTSPNPAHHSRRVKRMRKVKGRQGKEVEPEQAAQRFTPLAAGGLPGPSVSESSGDASGTSFTSTSAASEPQVPVDPWTFHDSFSQTALSAPANVPAVTGMGSITRPGGPVYQASYFGEPLIQAPISYSRGGAPH